MTLYSSNFDKQKEKRLEPYGTTDLWSAQSVAEGREIFLRHESVSDGLVTYYWLNSNTLEIEYQMADRGFSEQGVVGAGEHEVFILSRDGLRKLDHEQHVTTICNDQLCREDGRVQILSSSYIGVSARSGFGVVETDHGMIWSKSVNAKYVRQGYQNGNIRSNSSGTRIAVWVTGPKKALPDGVQVRGWPPTLLIYEVINPKDRLVLPIKPVDGDFDFAISPTGNKLAVFDGARIQVYSLD